MQEMSGLRVPDLTTKNRAINPNSGCLMPHSESRHLYFETCLSRENNNRFGQGSLFLHHVKAGDITEIERITAYEYHKFKKGLESKITNCQNAGGAERVTLELNQFGIKRIGSFIRRGSICTVFPEDE